MCNSVKGVEALCRRLALLQISKDLRIAVCSSSVPPEKPFVTLMWLYKSHKTLQQEDLRKSMQGLNLLASSNYI
jgi:hypothetical protein